MQWLAAPARAPSVRQRGLHTLLLGVGLFVAHLTRSAHAAQQTWNIACITSLTGILNATGTRIAAGARLFEQEFNAAGGMAFGGDTYTLNVTVLDDESLPSRAGALATAAVQGTLTGAPITMLTGVTSTPIGEAIALALATYNAAQEAITPGWTAANGALVLPVAVQAPNVVQSYFRMYCMQPERSSSYQFMLGSLRGRRVQSVVTIVERVGEDGSDLAARCTANESAYGLTSLARIELGSRDEAEISSAIATAGALHPQSIVLCSETAVTTSLLAAARAQDVNANAWGTPLNFDTDAARAASDFTLYEDLLRTTLWLPSLTLMPVDLLSCAAAPSMSGDVGVSPAAYAAAYAAANNGRDASVDDALMFSSLQALSTASVIAGSLAPAAVETVLRTNEFCTITRALSFTPLRKSRTTYLSTQLVGAALTEVILDPPPYKTAIIVFPRPTWKQSQCQLEGLCSEGTCAADGSCACTSGYAGPNCTIPIAVIIAVLGTMLFVALLACALFLRSRYRRQRAQRKREVAHRREVNMLTNAVLQQRASQLHYLEHELGNPLHVISSATNAVLDTLSELSHLLLLPDSGRADTGMRRSPSMSSTGAHSDVDVTSSRNFSSMLSATLLQAVRRGRRRAHAILPALHSVSRLLADLRTTDDAILGNEGYLPLEWRRVGILSLLRDVQWRLAADTGMHILLHCTPELTDMMVETDDLRMRQLLVHSLGLLVKAAADTEGSVEVMHIFAKSSRQEGDASAPAFHAAPAPARAVPPGLRARHVGVMATSLATLAESSEGVVRTSGVEEDGNALSLLPPPPITVPNREANSAPCTMIVTAVLGDVSSTSFVDNMPGMIVSSVTAPRANARAPSQMKEDLDLGGGSSGDASVDGSSSGNGTRRRAVAPAVISPRRGMVRLEASDAQHEAILMGDGAASGGDTSARSSPSYAASLGRAQTNDTRGSRGTAAPGRVAVDQVWRDAAPAVASPVAAPSPLACGVPATIDSPSSPRRQLDMTASTVDDASRSMPRSAHVSHIHTTHADVPLRTAGSAPHSPALNRAQDAAASDEGAASEPHDSMPLFVPAPPAPRGHPTARRASTSEMVPRASLIYQVAPPPAVAARSYSADQRHLTAYTLPLPFPTASLPRALDAATGVVASPSMNSADREAAAHHVGSRSVEHSVHSSHVGGAHSSSVLPGGSRSEMSTHAGRTANSSSQFSNAPHTRTAEKPPSSTGRVPWPWSHMTHNAAVAADAEEASVPSMDRLMWTLSSSAVLSLAAALHATVTWSMSQRTAEITFASRAPEDATTGFVPMLNNAVVPASPDSVTMLSSEEVVVDGTTAVHGVTRTPSERGPTAHARRASAGKGGTPVTVSQSVPASFVQPAGRRVRSARGGGGGGGGSGTPNEAADQSLRARSGNKLVSSNVRVSIPGVPLSGSTPPVELQHAPAGGPKAPPRRASDAGIHFGRASEPAQGAARELSLAIAAVPTRKYHVLVVDDESVNRSILLRMLRALGHTATAASDGAQALQLVASAHQLSLPDLMLAADGSPGTVHVHSLPAGAAAHTAGAAATHASPTYTPAAASSALGFFSRFRAGPTSGGTGTSHAFAPLAPTPAHVLAHPGSTSLASVATAADVCIDDAAGHGGAAHEVLMANAAGPQLAVTVLDDHVSTPTLHVADGAEGGTVGSGHSDPTSSAGGGPPGSEGSSSAAAAIVGGRLHAGLTPTSVPSGSPKPFDAIFMDIIMPNMSGIAAVKALRKVGYANPIFAVTALSSPVNLREFAEVGFTDCIAKPFSRVAIERALNTMNQWSPV